MMRPVISLLTVIVLFIWILPLGVLIRPDQEDAMCRGRRPICMCSKMMARNAAKQLTQIQFTSAGAAQKLNGGAGTLFDLSARSYLIKFTAIPMVVHDSNLLYSNPFSPSIEHIPIG